MSTTTATTAENIALAVNKTIMGRLAEKPTLRLIDLDSLTEDELKGFLQSKHCTAWGTTFTVTSADSLKKATDWFARELEGLHAFIAKVRLESMS